jgi:hypothetical protein
MSKGAVGSFGLFAVVWLSSISLSGPEAVRGRPPKDNQNRRSVRASSASRPIVDLD